MYIGIAGYTRVHGFSIDVYSLAHNTFVHFIRSLAGLIAERSFSFRIVPIAAIWESRERLANFIIIFF